MAVYPGGIATDADLKVGINNVRTRLVGAINASVTTITLSPASGVLVNTMISIGTEVMAVTAVLGGDQFTVVRGFDGTTAATHVNNAVVEGRVNAGYHNILKNEIIAIETALGTTPLAFQKIRRNAGRCGTVVVLPPTVQDGVGIVIAPDGTLVSTAGTLTSGLQEAINYAYNNGCNLYITGGAEPTHPVGTPGPTGGPVVYQCTATLVLKPMEGFWLFAPSITINVAPSTNTDPGIFVDTALIATVWMPGSQLVYAGRGPAIRFKPTNPAPIDLAFGIGMQLEFRIFSVVNIWTELGHPASDLDGVPLIEWDPTLGPITYSDFFFNEPNGSRMAMKIIDPPVGSAFFLCNVTGRFTHGQSGTGDVVQVGQTLAGGARISLIAWELGIDATNTGKGFSTFERNARKMDISTISGAQSYGVYFEPGAAGNTLTAGQLAGVNQLPSGYSVGGDLGKNQIWGMSAFGPVEFDIVPVLGTPYQNLMGQQLEIVSSGGTITGISVGANAGNVAPTGLVAGSFSLKPGMFIKWDGSVLPTTCKGIV